MFYILTKILFIADIAYNTVTKSWVWRNSQPGAPTETDRFHAQQVRLLTIDKVDFELGGTSNVPTNETYTASLFNKIIGLCCVGPDSVYQQSFPYNLDTTFGVQCSNAVYTQDFILTFSNLGAKTIALTYTEATFPYTTCQAALQYALYQASTPYTVVYQYQFWSGMEANGLNLDNPVYNPATNKTYNLKAAVAQLAAAKPDLMINCGGFNSGVYILQQLAKLGYSPKGTLQTTAPNSVQQYVAALGPIANYKYGVAQWFPTMRFKDNFFGTAPQYAADFYAYWGVQAEYVGAGAAATAWLLGTSIQQYYATRNHTPGVFNLNGILTQLKQTNVQSFFGQIAFNSFIRNYAKEPGTFQLIPDSSQPYGVRQGVVFPVQFGDSVYTFPDPASVPSQSPSNSLSTAAVIGIAFGCSVFCLCLMIIAGLMYRQHRKNKKSRVTRLRLQNLPVHAAIVRKPSVYDLLTEIDEHRETIALKDNEGFTALEIALEETFFTSDSITPEIILRLFCETYEITLSSFSDEMVMKGTEAQIQEFFHHFQCYEWAKLVQYSSERAFLAVELILNHFPKHCKIFSRVCDEHGRLVVDIASPKCKLAIQRRLWLHRRYEIREGRPEHVSATSIVVFAIDHASESVIDDSDRGTTPTSRVLSARERLDSFRSISAKNTNSVVALKFMRSYEQFHCEVTCREKLSLNTEFVIGVVASYGMDESDPEEHAFRIDSITKGFQSYPFCLVMEAGDMTLKRVIDNQHIAGANWDEIRNIARQTSTCLSHIHSRGLIHGDLKRKLLCFLLSKLIHFYYYLFVNMISLLFFLL